MRHCLTVRGFASGSRTVCVADLQIQASPYQNPAASLSPLGISHKDNPEIARGAMSFSVPKIKARMQILRGFLIPCGWRINGVLHAHCRYEHTEAH